MPFYYLGLQHMGKLIFCVLWSVNLIYFCTWTSNCLITIWWIPHGHVKYPFHQAHITSPVAQTKTLRVILTPVPNIQSINKPWQPDLPMPAIPHACQCCLLAPNQPTFAGVTSGPLISPCTSCLHSVELCLYKHIWWCHSLLTLRIKFSLTVHNPTMAWFLAAFLTSFPSVPHSPSPSCSLCCRYTCCSSHTGCVPGPLHLPFILPAISLSPDLCVATFTSFGFLIQYQSGPSQFTL